VSKLNHNIRGKACREGEKSKSMPLPPSEGLRSNQKERLSFRTTLRLLRETMGVSMS
jgi:hypothetical protein